jgi:hypothetical protein
VRYASAVDKLIPYEKTIFDVNVFARDSSAFYENAIGKSATVSWTGTNYSKNSSNQYDNGYYEYHFDKSGRVSNYSTWSKDSSFKNSNEFYYLKGDILKKKIFSTLDKVDTTVYNYDRAENLSGICAHGSCDERLYDNKHHLVVWRNAFYGIIEGDFTYEYNEDGKLVRRRFLELKSGIVLCTDTIEFIYNDLQKKDVTKKHSIQISGRPGWIPIDEKEFDKDLNRTIRYELFQGPRDKNQIPFPETSVYVYSGGKINSIRVENIDYKIEDQYFYHPTSDTIKSYRIVEDKKGTRKILWSQTVFIYNEKGLLLEKKTTEYGIIHVKRKWEVHLTDETLLTYHWK